jgi:NDP-sugar pyrophosphorylase family protein
MVATLPASVPLDFGHDVFPAALAHGFTICAYRLSGPVIDVGTPEALELARESLARRPVASRSEQGTPISAEGST